MYESGGAEVFCVLRAGRQVFFAACHPWRKHAATVLGTSGRRGASQEVRHGAEHQDGADEADAGAPTAADGLAKDAGAAATGARAHVQVPATSNMLHLPITTYHLLHGHSRYSHHHPSNDDSDVSRFPLRLVESMTVKLKRSDPSYAELRLYVY